MTISSPTLKPTVLFTSIVASPRPAAHTRLVTTAPGFVACVEVDVVDVLVVVVCVVLVLVEVVEVVVVLDVVVVTVVVVVVVVAST